MDAQLHSQRVNVNSPGESESGEDASRTLSGSHCGDRRPRCGRLQQNTTLGPNHTLSPVCEVLKAGVSGDRSLASSPGAAID